MSVYLADKSELGSIDANWRIVVSRDDTNLVRNVTQAGLLAALGVVVGDAGAGGTKGLVPAPGAGDSAANKFLKADGTWAVAAGGVTSLNALTGALSIVVGASGADVGVSASGSNVTVNIPDAAAGARGLVTTGTQTIAGSKTFTSPTLITSSGIPLTVTRPAHATSGRYLSCVQAGVEEAYIATGLMDGYGGKVFVGLSPTSYTLLNHNLGYPYLETSQATFQFKVNGGATSAGLVFGSSYGTFAVNGLVTFATSREATTRTGIAASSLDLTAGMSAGPITFAVLNATTATATLGVYRITDRSNRLAYPDGTNWRFVSDDAIIS